MDDIPGWYVDAMEQNLGLIINKQREKSPSVEQVVELFMDPATSTEGVSLTPDEHLWTLAVCLAICVRRLARVDLRA